MIYVGLVGVLTAPIVAVTQQVARATHEADLVARVVERNSTILDRMSDDFRNAINGSAVLDNGGKTIILDLAGTFDGSTYTPGNTIRYHIVGNSSQAEDSSNNFIQRVNDDTGETLSIGSYIDVNSSLFALNGDGIVATITNFGTSHKTDISTRMTQTILIFPLNN